VTRPPVLARLQRGRGRGRRALLAAAAAAPVAVVVAAAAVAPRGGGARVGGRSRAVRVGRGGGGGWGPRHGSRRRRRSSSRGFTRPGKRGSICVAAKMSPFPRALGRYGFPGKRKEGYLPLPGLNVGLDSSQEKKMGLGHVGLDSSPGEKSVPGSSQINFISKYTSSFPNYKLILLF